MKQSYVLELGEDYYSLSLFSFYLDLDDEDLCEMKNFDEVKEKLQKQKTMIQGKKEST